MATETAPGVCLGPDGKLLNTRPLRVTWYRRGAIVTGWDYDGPTGGGKRGKIQGWTDESRYRFGFQLDNAPDPWGATTLLTFGKDHLEPKKPLERFFRLMRQAVGEIPYAWWLESTKKRRAHFHVLWHGPTLQERGWTDGSHVETLGRGDEARAVLRGPLDDVCAASWIRAVGDKTPKFTSFQMGGTSEVVRDSSRLAWYPASEAVKREQKCLPRGISFPGRWWWIHPRQRPRSIGLVDVCTYPLERKMKFVYDAEPLGQCEWVNVDGSAVDA